jgi:hypothetical protein
LAITCSSGAKRALNRRGSKGRVIDRGLPKAAVAAGPDEPEAVLRNVERQAASLSDRGKELVLRAAVVAAPKPLTEGSGALVIEIGRRLGMAPEAVYATLAELSAR